MKFLVPILLILLLTACGSKSNETHPVYKDLTETVFASGVLEPEGRYNLTAQAEGYLVDVRLREGELVQTNEILAVIDNKQNLYSQKSADELLQISRRNVQSDAPAIRQTEASLLLAQAKVKMDEKQVARYRNLLETKSVSQLEYDNVVLALENSKAQLKGFQEALRLQKQQAEQQLIVQEAQKDINAVSGGNNQIRAVVGGKVYRKMKELGDYVRRGDVLAVIGSPDRIYARLNIDESNIAKVKVGQKALVQLNSQKDMVYDGELFEILPAFEESSQSFIGKVKLAREPELALSGTQLQANLIVGHKTHALVIPRSYLDYGNKVYIKGKDDPVQIKTGFVSTDWVEVLEGLKTEDVVIRKTN